MSSSDLLMATKYLSAAIHKRPLRASNTGEVRRLIEFLQVYRHASSNRLGFRFKFVRRNESKQNDSTYTYTRMHGPHVSPAAVSPFNDNVCFQRNSQGFFAHRVRTHRGVHDTTLRDVARFSSLSLSLRNLFRL